MFLQKLIFGIKFLFDVNKKHFISLFSYRILFYINFSFPQKRKAFDKENRKSGGKPSQSFSPVQVNRFPSNICCFHKIHHQGSPQKLLFLGYDGSVLTLVTARNYFKVENLLVRSPKNHRGHTYQNEWSMLKSVKPIIGSKP